MSFRTRRDAATEDTRTVARVRGALEGYKAGGANSVSIAHVLDLLDARGLWSHDPQRHAMAAQPGDVDPLTGCKPTTAPGV